MLLKHMINFLIKRGKKNRQEAGKVVGMLRNSGGSPAATNNPCVATRILINRIFMIP
jgi:hypothetical protein